jgi:hypothetical protein
MVFRGMAATRWRRCRPAGFTPLARRGTHRRRPAMKKYEMLAAAGIALVAVAAATRPGP